MVSRAGPLPHSHHQAMFGPKPGCVLQRAAAEHHAWWLNICSATRNKPKHGLHMTCTSTDQIAPTRRVYPARSCNRDDQATPASLRHRLIGLVISQSASRQGAVQTAAAARWQLRNGDTQGTPATTHDAQQCRLGLAWQHHTTAVTVTVSDRE